MACRRATASSFPFTRLGWTLISTRQLSSSLRLKLPCQLSSIPNAVAGALLVVLATNQSNTSCSPPLRDGCTCALKSAPTAVKQSDVYSSFWDSHDELSSSLGVTEFEHQEAPNSDLSRLCEANFFGGTSPCTTATGIQTS